MPGSPAYDDVWAVGDGAVYVVDAATAHVVAYELADGAERWRRPFDGLRNSWPYVAAGGIVFAIVNQLGIPVRFIGTGEKADDLAPFDPEFFVDTLLGEE